MQPAVLWRQWQTRLAHSLRWRLYALAAGLGLLGLALVGATALGGWSGWLTLPIWLAACIWAGFGLRRMLLPLDGLQAGVRALAKGQFGHRIEFDGNDELGELAERLNQMAADTQSLIKGKRALLMAVSHELRNPLARARLHAELMEEGPSREALLAELALMRELISALLETERLGAGSKALRRSECDLVRLAEGFARPGLRIEHEETLPQVRVDPPRMQLLMRNLINNALMHNEPLRGPVTVRLRKEGPGLRLVVRDYGPGVPQSALARLGEPFYRVETSTPTGQGVGLGLTLCKLIAAAHGSRLELRNVEPGLEASVLLA
ncbi:MAG: HAMP domain-containing histidine kinase [Paucibacter sp.]|nr:HAMP domain-containing histidine kinase [Roseateles sp.]